MLSNSERVGHTITINFVTKHKIYKRIYDNEDDHEGVLWIEFIVRNDPIYCEHLDKYAYPIINFIINDKRMNQTEFNEKYFKHPTLEPHDYELLLLISQKKLAKIHGKFFTIMINKPYYRDYYERQLIYTSAYEEEVYEFLKEPCG
jgi:hypothetical protein